MPESLLPYYGGNDWKNKIQIDFVFLKVEIQRFIDPLDFFENFCSNFAKTAPPIRDRSERCIRRRPTAAGAVLTAAMRPQRSAVQVPI